MAEEDDEGRLLTEDEINALLSSLGSEEEEGEAAASEAAEEVVTAPSSPAAPTAPAPAPVATAPAAVPAPAPVSVPVARDVKTYDFRHPERLSRDHLRNLGSVHETFARQLASTLAGLLRTSVELELSSVEQSAYDAYVQRAADINLYQPIALEPLPGAAVLEVNSAAVYAMLERLEGSGGRAMTLQRKFTDLEGGLFRLSLAPYVLASLREAWHNLVEITPAAVGEVTTNASSLQVALPSDAVAIVTLSGRVAEVEASLRLCLPHTTLEPVLPKLGAQSLFRPPRQTHGNEAAAMRRRLATISLPVIAQLGTATVTVDELLGLQLGDVIRLESLADQEVEVLVNGRPKYLARPGLVGSRVAVRIAQVLEEDADNPVEDEDSGDGGS